MRIGVVTTSFPRRPDDIAGNFVLASCRALIDRGHSIHVLAPEPPEPVERFSVARLDVTHIPYLRPRSLQRTFYGAGVPDNLATDPRAWLGIAPFSAALAAAVTVHARQWDAVITHWALPCALAASFRPNRCRHLSVLHSADVHLLARLPGGSSLSRKVVTQADHLWFTSESLRKKFGRSLGASQRDSLAHKSTCHPMPVAAPVETQDRNAVRADLGVSGFVALALGRLVPVKGLVHAIEALRGTGAQLVIAGEGPERERLEQAARSLGVPVRFVGVVTGRDKSNWITAADALLVPSIVLSSGRTEGVPTAAIEAMAHGCPVIASDVGGMRDLITHGDNGWLVDPGSADGIREALFALMNDGGLRSSLAERGRNSTRALRWSHVAQTWEALLRGSAQQQTATDSRDAYPPAAETETGRPARHG